MRVLPTDAELIDLVKQTFNYDTDVQVAGFLGVTKDTVSAIRNNRTVVGEGLRFTILDKLLVLDKIAYRKGENALFKEGKGEDEDRHKPRDAETDDLQHRSLASACSPKALLIRLREWRQQQRQAQDERWALKETEDGPPVSEDAELLNLYKEYRQFDTDAQVSKTLGIKRNSISMVRHGRSRLGPLPRLRIYRDIYGRDTSKLEAALESSEALLNLMKNCATETDANWVNEGAKGSVHGNPTST